MPFFGFLGGVVLAALVLVLLSESRRSRAARRGFDLLLLPWPAYALATAYAALFVVMWAYYFDGDFTRMKADLPDAELFHILRGFLFQLESGDFIITLLAFLCGGLAVVALARAGRGGGDNPKDQAAQPQGAGAEGDQGGLGAAALRQLRRITALNTLLVFALFLFTLPALLPWIERRLSIVKLGDFEAHLVPLTDKSRGSSDRDTPALYVKKHIGIWLGVLAAIERTVHVVERTPELHGNGPRQAKKAIFDYEVTGRFFADNVIPTAARLYCMSALAGVSPASVPGAREASSAFITALKEQDEGKKIKSLLSALNYMKIADKYYRSHYFHLNTRCHEKIVAMYGGLFDETISLVTVKHRHRRSTIKLNWNCLPAASERRCLQALRNGYTIRFIMEFADFTSGQGSNNYQFMLVEDDWLSPDRYKEYGLTPIDHLNLQVVRVGYKTALGYPPDELIMEYAAVKETAYGIIEAVSIACSSCSGGRRPKAGMADSLEAYRRYGLWYIDADAVAQIGARMLGRVSMNNFSVTERAALEGLMASAARSRDEIQLGISEELETTASVDQWATAMLDEGIATIRYVQLAEAPDSPRQEQRLACDAASERLRASIATYEKLSSSSPEHRFNRMRAERTLALVDQYCSGL